jgi:hypothetical protein
VPGARDQAGGAEFFEALVDEEFDHRAGRVTEGSSGSECLSRASAATSLLHHAAPWPGGQSVSGLRFRVAFGGELEDLR